jgi:hypothetical protein
MRAYSPTLSYSQAQGCITSTLANGGNLDVAAAFDACGLGQVVSEGMAAYRAANPAPTQPSNTGPPAATLFPAKPAQQPKPRIARITFKHHVLRITVAGIPSGMRLQLVVQERGELGKFVTLAQRITGRRTSTLRVERWDRIVARFLARGIELPAVSVTSVAHGKRTGSRKQGMR